MINIVEKYLPLVNKFNLGDGGEFAWINGVLYGGEFFFWTNPDDNSRISSPAPDNRQYGIYKNISKVEFIRVYMNIYYELYKLKGFLEGNSPIGSVDKNTKNLFIDFFELFEDWDTILSNGDIHPRIGIYSVESKSLFFRTNIQTSSPHIHRTVQKILELYLKDVINDNLENLICIKRNIIYSRKPIDININLPYERTIIPWGVFLERGSLTIQSDGEIMCDISSTIDLSSWSEWFRSEVRLHNLDTLLDK